jgi:hypothetical protein
MSKILSLRRRASYYSVIQKRNDVYNVRNTNISSFDDTLVLEFGEDGAEKSMKIYVPTNDKLGNSVFLQLLSNRHLEQRVETRNMAGYVGSSQ